MQLTTTKEKEIAVCRGDWRAELAKYTPAAITQLLKCNPVAALNRPTPTLAQVFKRHGMAGVTEYLHTLLKFVCDTLGVDANDIMLTATANGIYSACYGWRLGELLVFFSQFVAGKYGRFYGRFDNAIIYEGLQKFWRAEALPVRQAAERAEIDARRAAWARDAITPDEFARRNGLPEGLSVAEIAELLHKRDNTP